jgi:excisionase family DNA binding protein
MSAKAQAQQFRADDRLVTIREAAYLLAMKVSTVYQWISQGRISVVKFRRSVRIKFSVIQQLIAEAERPAAKIG